MIEHRIGDLFDQPDINIIIHQCNIYNTMGAGIARVIADKFPWAKAADDNTTAGNEAKLGTYTRGVNLDADAKIKLIFNIYTQIGVGNDGMVENRNTRYDLLVDTLHAVKRSIRRLKMIQSLRNNEDEPEPIVGIPYGLGSDLAGGSWKIVSAIIESVFADEDFNVIVCRLPNSKELV